MIRIDDILEKLVDEIPEKDLNLIKKAYVFTAKAHQGQIRRSGEPYLSHPLEVANMLAEMGMDKTTIAAALLHDVIEDTNATIKELNTSFGKEISLLVEGVTKMSRLQESSPETRHAESIRKIILAMTDDLRVIFIKLADRIHNLKTLNFLPENKQRQIARETLDIYAPIANRLGMGKIKAELEDLAFRYVDTENYYKIVSWEEPQRKISTLELRKIRKTINRLLRGNNIPVEIFFRIKRPYSIYTKLQQQKIELSQVYDFLALRIITNSVRNCYAILGIIHQIWPHIPHRFRDFVAMPKPNLYQALHTTIITEGKKMFEIQIRTQDMHNLAENGIAAHWKYKDPDRHSIMKDDKRLFWLREMADLYKEQKNPKEFLKLLKTDLIAEEIYVFTPKGKVVPLPLGASALDFAFRIHSEIGLHASGAKINNELVPLKTILKTGDIVEVFHSPEIAPSLSWLNHVLSSKAKHHIKYWSNVQERKRNIEMGEKLWKKQLQKSFPSMLRIKKGILLKRIEEYFGSNIKKFDDFYSLVGNGKIIINEKIVENIFLSMAKKKSVIFPSKKEPPLSIQKTTPDIKVQISDGKLSRFAKCCSPINGEPIVGYMTKGKGVTIHSLRCSWVQKNKLDQHKMIPASWNEAKKGTCYGKILINSLDSPGLLAKITTIIAGLNGNIKKADLKTFSDKKVQIRLLLEIKNIKQFNEIFDNISEVKGLSSIERI